MTEQGKKFTPTKFAERKVLASMGLAEPGGKALGVGAPLREFLFMWQIMAQNFFKWEIQKCTCEQMD
jgi:hypothetical protein